MGVHSVWSVKEFAGMVEGDVGLLCLFISQGGYEIEETNDMTLFPNNLEFISLGPNG